MPETTPPTPTLDKMRAVHDQSQAIGEFVEWLSARGIVLAESWHEATYVCATCGVVPADDGMIQRMPWTDDETYRHVGACPQDANSVDCLPAGLYSATVTLTTLLHEFFGIDAAAAERERRALLTHVRAAAART